MLDFQGLYFVIFDVLVRICADVTSLKAMECSRHRWKDLRICFLVLTSCLPTHYRCRDYSPTLSHSVTHRHTW